MEKRRSTRRRSTRALRRMLAGPHRAKKKSIEEPRSALTGASRGVRVLTTDRICPCRQSCCWALASPIGQKAGTLIVEFFEPAPWHGTKHTEPIQQTGFNSPPLSVSTRKASNTVTPLRLHGNSPFVQRTGPGRRHSSTGRYLAAAASGSSRRTPRDVMLTTATHGVPPLLAVAGEVTWRNQRL